jgi:hypothetical protein
MLLKDMAPEDMAHICSKALMALLDDSAGVTLEYGGHRYIVHRDGDMLFVAQADKIPSVSDTVLWEFGYTGDEGDYLGI